MARDTRQRFLAEIRKLEPGLRKAFVEAVGDIRNSANLELVVQALERGDVEGAVRALNSNVPFYARVQAKVRELFGVSGAYIEATLPKRNPVTREALVFRFEGEHPRAQEYIQRQAGALIQNLEDEKLNAVRNVLSEGLAEGRNPRSVALDLVGRVSKVTGRRTGGSIGLTGGEADRVIAYRGKLESEDRDPAQINRMVVKRQNRLLRLRGERIARTETLKAMNAGKLESYRQMVDQGLVRADQLEKVWDATLDGRVRNSHAWMNDQRVGLEEPFTSPRGALLMHPGDTSLGAPAREVVQCRCFMRVDIDFAKGVR